MITNQNDNHKWLQMITNKNDNPKWLFILVSDLIRVNTFDKSFECVLSILQNFYFTLINNYKLRSKTQF